MEQSKLASPPHIRSNVDAAADHQPDVHVVVHAVGIDGMVQARLQLFPGQYQVEVQGLGAFPQPVPRIETDRRHVLLALHHAPARRPQDRGVAILRPFHRVAARLQHGGEIVAEARVVLAGHTQRFGELGQGRPCIPVQGAEQPAIQIVHDCFSFRLSECHFEHFAVFSQAITRV